MNKVIALLRGINVGGNSILPMKELKVILGELGCQKVQTYIQSGNVVFETDFSNLSEFSLLLRSAINTRFGFEPFVFLMNVDKLQDAVLKNPFPVDAANENALHIGFLAGIPSNPDLQKLDGLRTQSEKFQLIDDLYYFFAPDGVGRSKFAANIERFLGVPITDRNLRTVKKVLELTKN